MLDDLILALCDFLGGQPLLIKQLIASQEVRERPHLCPLGHENVVVHEGRYAVIASLIFNPFEIRRAEHEKELSGPHATYLSVRQSVTVPEEVVASLPPSAVTEEFWSIPEAVPLYVARIFSATCAIRGFWAITIRQSERPWDKK